MLPLELALVLLSLPVKTYKVNCWIIYSDTSANEDNSFRGHIR
jgi:hypothetical protein